MPSLISDASSSPGVGELDTSSQHSEEEEEETSDGSEGSACISRYSAVASDARHRVSTARRLVARILRVNSPEDVSRKARYDGKAKRITCVLWKFGRYKPPQPIMSMVTDMLADVFGHPWEVFECFGDVHAEFAV
jgi:hypothetical protein